MISVQEIKNEEIILSDVIKWLFLSIFAGSLTGGVIAAFLLVLQNSIQWVDSLAQWKYVLLPVGFIGSIYSIRLISPQAEGHGTDKVISAIHYRAARIPFSVVPAKILSTIFTLAPGGVVGTEGPSVQIGAGFTSALAILMKFPEKERKKLVVCGVSAALSAVLGAPIGGAVFGVEVLFVGEIFYPVLLPAVISSISSYFVCTSLGLHYDLPYVVIPALSVQTMGWCILAAVFFSLICIYHIETVRFICEKIRSMKIPLLVKAMIASGILLTVSSLGMENFLGTGEEGVKSCLSGQVQPWYSCLLKSVLLAITLSAGGSGGVLTPTFYVGAAGGSLFATILGLDNGFFAALGFVACIAGAVNTPLAAVLIAVEMFGCDMAPYAGVVCIICYMLTGLRSLYPTQILIQPKSDALVLAEPQNKRSWKVKQKKVPYKRFPLSRKRVAFKSSRRHLTE